MYRFKVPTLVCSDGFRAFLQRHCPVVAERFSPTPWCWGGRMQTLVRVLLKTNPAVTYRNELIQTGDGGQLSLDWFDNTDSARYPQCSSRPTVLILPGLTGNSQQTYVLHAVQQASRHGYRCVVMNNRGFGGEELLTPLTFCAANTSDVETVVNHVKGLFPQAPLLGAGVSLGGMLLLNYLAHKGRDAKIIAALTMSVSWDSFESSASLEQPINKLLFNRHLTSNLCRAVKRHRKILENAIDVDYVLKARTIREFDERFTSVLFGYKSCSDYYRDASPGYKLPRTSVPVLCLNAADDPFSPEHGETAHPRRGRSVDISLRCDTVLVHAEPDVGCFLSLIMAALSLSSFPSNRSPAPAQRGSAGDVSRRPHRLPGGPVPVRCRLHGPPVWPVRVGCVRALGRPEGSVRCRRRDRRVMETPYVKQTVFNQSPFSSAQ
uniref:Phospholipase ABHD3 n=1 Tax=Electrophorus electricus TaxID=8005 RepID=A0AAY5EVV4_ELEEL